MPLPLPQQSSGSHWAVLVGLLLGGFILGGFTVGLIMAATPDSTDESASGGDDALSGYVENALTENGETPEEAVARYTEELERRPESAQLHLWRGNAYEELYETDLANDDYTRAIELDPNEVAYYEARAQLNRWRDADSTLADYLVIVDMEPDVSRHRTGLASAYEELGENAAALAQYTTAIDLTPNDLTNYELRARLNLDMGDGPAAIADYTYLIDEDPGASRYGARGWAHSQLDNHRDAIADYTEAYRLDEESTYYLEQRATIHAITGDVEAAIADYTKSIAADSYWAPYNQRGELLWTQGRYDEALADFDEAVSIDAITGRFRRGRALAELGRYEEALRDLDLVVDEGVTDYGYDYLAYEYQILLEDVLYIRATVHADLGDYQGAIADLELMTEWSNAIGRAPRPRLVNDDVARWIEDLNQSVNPFDQ